MKNKSCNSVLFPVILFVSAAFYSCKFEANRVSFSNNLDDMSVWLDRNNLTDTISYSGRYSAYVNPALPYGISFKAKFREISNKKIKKVRVSFYAYEMDSLSLGSMVFEIRTKANETVFWRSAKAHEMIVPKKWTIVTQEYDLSGESIQEDDEIRAYPWCRGTSETFFDDILLEFYW